jgi:hypothetical protein
MVLNFKDKSRFKTHWNLGEGFGETLRVDLRKEYSLVRDEKLEQSLNLAQKEEIFKKGKDKGVTIILGGVIKEFEVSRFGVYSIMVGGYRSFKVKVKLKVIGYDILKRKKFLDEEFSHEKVAPKLVVTPLGIPPPHLEDEFKILKSIAWGSDEFKNTLVGKVVQEVVGKIKKRLNTFYPVKKTLSGKIIYIEEERIYINLGSADGLKGGEILSIYRVGKPIKDPGTGETIPGVEKLIGKIRVKEIKDKHLAIALLKEGKVNEFKEGDLVKQE